MARDHHLGPELLESEVSIILKSGIELYYSGIKLCAFSI